MSQNGKVTKPSLKGQCQDMEFETLCECICENMCKMKIVIMRFKGIVWRQKVENFVFRPL